MWTFNMVVLIGIHLCICYHRRCGVGRKQMKAPAPVNRSLLRPEAQFHCVILLYEYCNGIAHSNLRTNRQQVGASCCGRYWLNWCSTMVPSFWGQIEGQASRPVSRDYDTSRMKDNADFIDISIMVSSITRKTILWTRNEWSLNRERWHRILLLFQSLVRSSSLRKLVGLLEFVFRFIKAPSIIIYRLVRDSLGRSVTSY